MRNELVTVRNLSTRKVGKVRRSIAEHPILGANLEIVPEGSKDIVTIAPLVLPEEQESHEDHLVEYEEE